MKGTGAAQPHPEPGWLQPHHAHTRRDPSRGIFLTGRPKPNLALEAGSRHHFSMVSSPSAAFLRLRATISERVKRMEGRGLSGNGHQAADPSARHPS
jgi:hypothetical protein